MEQLVAYCGVNILLNLRLFADIAEFHCLYGSVPLYNNNEKCQAWQHFFEHIDNKVGCFKRRCLMNNWGCLKRSGGGDMRKIGPRWRRFIWDWLFWIPLINILQMALFIFSIVKSIFNFLNCLINQYPYEIFVESMQYGIYWRHSRPSSKVDGGT